MLLILIRYNLLTNKKTPLHSKKRLYIFGQGGGWGSFSETLVQRSVHTAATFPFLFCDVVSWIFALNWAWQMQGNYLNTGMFKWMSLQMWSHVTKTVVATMKYLHYLVKWIIMICGQTSGVFLMALLDCSPFTPRSLRIRSSEWPAKPQHPTLTGSQRDFPAFAPALCDELCVFGPLLLVGLVNLVLPRDTSEIQHEVHECMHSHHAAHTLICYCV